MNKKLQTNFDIFRLYNENNVPPPVIKVGILPFIAPSEEGGEWQIMVMKPKAENECLGDPQFQIAKGTRRININGDWCDMREDDLLYADESFHEPRETTALREGMEEIGLKAINIKGLYDMGGFSFTSASRKIKRPLHMFAAELRDPKDFSEFEETTDETAWMTCSKFESVGRPDHVIIMNELMALLKAGYSKQPPLVKKTPPSSGGASR